MFLNDETGAVTVDWVVLTAGIVGLGLATMAVVSQGAQDTSTDISDQMTDQGIGITAFDFGGLWAANTDGSFVINGFSDTANGNFLVAGSGIHGVSENGGVSINDRAAGNGTHVMTFDDPVSDLTVSMTSLNGPSSIGGAEVILQDGTRVAVTADHYTTGENPMDIDVTSGNLNPASVQETGGEFWFSGSGGQSEVTFDFNTSNVAGLSADNPIVGFEYDQNSTGTGATEYQVYTDATPL